MEELELKTFLLLLLSTGPARQNFGRSDNFFICATLYVRHKMWNILPYTQSAKNSASPTKFASLSDLLSGKFWYINIGIFAFQSSFPNFEDLSPIFSKFKDPRKGRNIPAELSLRLSNNPVKYLVWR